MAPVPKDTNKPQDKNDMEESGLDSFHNPNLTEANGGNSDSSDDEYDSNMVTPGGYSLLPSEPGIEQEDSESDAENEITAEHDLHANSQAESASTSGATEGAASSATVSDYLQSETLPNALLSSEAGSSNPTIHNSESVSNPAAREKFPHGKIPSYLQVPSLPKDKEGHLWNEKRQGGKKQTLDKGQESAILKAISGFQLPPESIPAWAKNIPEDQWRQQVHSHIVTYRDGSTTMKGQDSTTVSTSDQNWVAEFPEDS